MSTSQKIAPRLHRRSAVSLGSLFALLALGLGCGSLSAPPPSPTSPSLGRAGAASTRSATDPATGLLGTARSLLGSPYRLAGARPDGFDCSGLTSYVFSAAGLALPRTAEGQAEIGTWVALDELQPGDLVFFSDPREKPHHVGLVVSQPGEPLTMIHASTSRGVVETVVTSSAYWLARLAFGRRILPPG